VWQELNSHRASTQPQSGKVQRTIYPSVRIPADRRIDRNSLGSEGELVAYSVTVHWQDDEDAIINTTEELSVLLDRISREALPPYFPLVQISSTDGTLTVGVGAPVSTVNHVPPDGNPPYLISVGNNDSEEQFDFYLVGHHSQFSARNTIANHLARAAAFEFAEKGVLTSKIVWEQC
jgi:hypothetical protein